MWHVTYFMITIIHNITEAESVKKHIGETCLLDLCTTIFQKVMATTFQDGGHFKHENHFLDSFSKLFSDLGIKSYIFDHAESEFRPPEFSKSLFYKL